MTKYDRSGDYQASDKSGASVALTMLMIGMGVGAAIALLFAPSSGTALRQNMRRRYDDTVDNVSNRAREWKNRGSEIVTNVRDRVPGMASKTGETPMAR